MLLRLARATAGHLCSKRRGRSHGSLARILRLALPPVALRSPMTGNELLPRRQPGISDSNPDCLCPIYSSSTGPTLFTPRVAKPPQYLAFEISPSPPLNRSPPFQPH